MLCCNCDPHCFSSLHVPALSLSLSPGSCSHSVKRPGQHCPEFPGLSWLLGPKHQSNTNGTVQISGLPMRLIDRFLLFAIIIYPCISAYRLISLNLVASPNSSASLYMDNGSCIHSHDNAGSESTAVQSFHKLSNITTEIEPICHPSAMWSLKSLRICICQRLCRQNFSRGRSSLSHQSSAFSILHKAKLSLIQSAVLPSSQQHLPPSRPCPVAFAFRGSTSPYRYLLPLGPSIRRRWNTRQSPTRP